VALPPAELAGRGGPLALELPAGVGERQAAAHEQGREQDQPDLVAGGLGELDLAALRIPVVADDPLVLALDRGLLALDRGLLALDRGLLAHVGVLLRHDGPSDQREGQQRGPGEQQHLLESVHGAAS
jgi:hypothetical protein